MGLVEAATGRNPKGSREGAEETERRERKQPEGPGEAQVPAEKRHVAWPRVPVGTEAVLGADGSHLMLRRRPGTVPLVPFACPAWPLSPSGR